MGILSKLIGADIGTAITTISSTIDRFVETPEEKQAAEILKAKIAQEPHILQIELNKEEAASKSMFVAGWRPSVGWICSVGLGIHYVINPIMEWGTQILGYNLTGPQMDMGTLMPLVVSLLGLGAYRTYEKQQGVTK